MVLFAVAACALFAASFAFAVPFVASRIGDTLPSAVATATGYVVGVALCVLGLAMVICVW